MPTYKIAGWERRTELDEKLKLVDASQISLKEVHAWCLSQGFNISMSALSSYRNSMATATTERISHISEKIEERAKAHFNMKDDLIEIIKKLKTALDNTDVSSMVAENPREAATLALAVANLAKTISELERSETTEQKSVLLTMISQKQASPIPESSSNESIELVDAE